MIELPTDLHILRGEMLARDPPREIWAVGGGPRDILAGKPFKDLDFATNATVAELKEIGERSSVVRKVIPTGEDHGTLTFAMESGFYEITMLRTERKHDGRRAEVEYTGELHLDLARRDLTINAIAMTFNGDIIDPFGGQDDLLNGVVRFVGDPNERMKEDYLRILRWYRFHGRYGKGPLDAKASIAACKHAGGLREMSKERLWTEMKQLVTGPQTVLLLEHMATVGVLKAMGFEEGYLNFYLLERAILNGVTDPVTLMVALLGQNQYAVQAWTDSWKLSNVEVNKAFFLVGHNDCTQLKLKLLLARHGLSRDWVVDLARIGRLNRNVADWLSTWDVPLFPLKGSDLRAAGHPEGVELGAKLNELRDYWAYHDYTPTREDLLSRL